jgi:hypothetical protein
MTPALTIAVLAGVGVKPKFSSLDSRILPITTAFVSGVERDLASGLFERASRCRHNCFVIMQRLFDSRNAAKQRSAAAGNNAFFDCRASGVHGVLSASFLSFSSVSVAAPTR